jgi:hypothetical protein
LFAEHIARLVESAVFLRPPFDGAGLEATWTKRNKTQLEFGSAVDSIGQPTYCVDEADSIHGHMLALSRLQHHQADELAFP